MASIEITGIEEVQRKLQTLERSLTGEEMEYKMYTVGEVLATVTEESFDKERSPFGVPWRPRKRSRKGQSSMLLYDTGDLAGHWVVQATPKEVILSNNKAPAYGAVHQFGSRKTSGRGSGIPARPFLPIDNSGRIEPGLIPKIIKKLKEGLVEL